MGSIVNEVDGTEKQEEPQTAFSLEENLSEQPTALEEENLTEQTSALEENLTEQTTALEENISEQPTALEENLTEQPIASEEKLSEQPTALEENLSEQTTALEENLSEQPTKAEVPNNGENIAVESTVATDEVDATPFDVGYGNVHPEMGEGQVDFMEVLETPAVQVY